MFKKTLISEFFTTISFKQVLYSLNFMTFKLPFLRYGKGVAEIENELLTYLGVQDYKIISFYNGRSAIYHCLKLIGVNEKDEVIVSGYTCVSVSNAVIGSGAKIVYSDIRKKDFGLDIKELESNITKKTKVIIVQHTFGKPSHNINKIVELANKHNILIIEDCAHSLGSRINKQHLGTFGDFSIFSTGRDKVISSITGGFLIINNKNYFSKMSKVESTLQMPTILLTLKNLNYNIVGYKAYKLYDFFKLGKVIIFLSRKFNLITEILTKFEKKCEYKEFYYKLPNSLAFLASKQLSYIKIISRHRRSIAGYYDDSIDNEFIKPLFKVNISEKNNYFRYIIIVKNIDIKEELYSYMKSNNVLLGDTWSNGNIAPLGSDYKKAQYISGSCKIAENVSKRILTIPNHKLISIDDAGRIVELLNNFKK